MTRGTGVIEVYVRQEDLVHVSQGDAVGPHASHEGLEARRRPGLDDRRRAVVAEQQEGGYHVLGTHEVQV